MTTTIDGYELKPCPFCGCEELKFFDDLKGTAFIDCQNDDCLASGPAGITKSDAAEKWNERRGFTDPLDAWKDTP